MTALDQFHKLPSGHHLLIGDADDVVEELTLLRRLLDFQARAVAWVREAFGSAPAEHKAERAHRFLEEALEAVQAAGTTKEEALKLVDYVYARPAGEIGQELGGVMLTLAPFAAANGIELFVAAETELARVNTPAVIARCREKNASKPHNSPLPGTASAGQ